MSDAFEMVAFKWPGPFEGSPTDPSEWIAILALVGIALILITQFVPTWILLARCLPQHGHTNRTWHALVTLLGLLLRGLQARSLHKAARLRIEIELLDPAPDRPLPRYDEGRDAYRAAVKDWRGDHREWKSRVNVRLSALVQDVAEDEAYPAIPVENCSPLIDNRGIDRYFSALSHQRLRPRQKPVFLSNVVIRSGFAAPLHLLTGVLARYGKEWKPVVEGYGEAVIRPDDVLRYGEARRVQVFIFDCWLLWGPSIPICTCPEWHGDVALQYGYGDENNSLTLRCPTPQVLRAFDRRNDGPDAPPFAVHTRVSGTLKWGPVFQETGVCPAQAAIWQDDRLVLDITGQADGIRPAGGTETQIFAKYYSAYLWIVLLICNADTGEPLHPNDKWRDMIPFFLHGNIADNEIYDFQTTQLARSAFEGAVTLLGSEERIGFALRFVCAIDETGCGYDSMYPMPAKKTIRQKMEKFKKSNTVDPKGAILERLILDYDKKSPFHDGDYSACALPGIVQYYYEGMKAGETTFRELRFTRRADRALLKRFYEDCFVPEFPDQDERETLHNILDYLHKKEDGWYGKNNYHVVIALHDSKPIGGAIADYLSEPNAGVIEYLVVQPERRGTGIGRRLLDATEQLLRADADETCGRRLDWILAEMDDPYLTPRQTNELDPFARIQVWHNLGYRLLDFPYVQPALARGKHPVTNLLLAVKTCSHRFGLDRSMSNGGTKSQAVTSVDVENFLRAYLRWAMRIDNANANDAFARMCEFLHTKSSIALIDFADYLGWEKNAHLRVNEVINENDPELDAAIRVYNEIFTAPDTAIADSEFARAFQASGLAHRACDHFYYHLWSIRGDSDGRCGGLASFLTMPDACFGGYLGLVRELRGSGNLRPLLARIEQQMVRDGTHASGCYIECAGNTEYGIFTKLGFHELDVDYYQPSLPGKSIEPSARTIHLLYKPFGRVYYPPTLTKDAFLAAVAEIYQSIYNVAEPNKDQTFIKLEESIKDITYVTTRPTPPPSVRQPA